MIAAFSKISLISVVFHTLRSPVIGALITEDLTKTASKTLLF
jgi:hypothetical protein